MHQPKRRLETFWHGFLTVNSWIGIGLSTIVIFIAVGLRSSNLAASKAYWCGVLGMSEFATPPGLDSGAAASLTVGWAAEQTHLQFVDVGDGAAVNHALASGRIANSCRAVEPFYEAAKASGQGSIMNTPITLPTPGNVTIRFQAKDFDGPSLAHCHIFSHADLGMLHAFSIQPAA